MVKLVYTYALGAYAFGVLVRVQSRAPLKNTHLRVLFVEIDYFAIHRIILLSTNFELSVGVADEPPRTTLVAYLQYAKIIPFY